MIDLFHSLNNWSKQQFTEWIEKKNIELQREGGGVGGSYVDISQRWPPALWRVSPTK